MLAFMHTPENKIIFEYSHKKNKKNVWAYYIRCMSKELAKKDMQIRVQPSLFDKFQQKCNENYKKMSEVLRELMVEYINKGAKWTNRKKKTI